MNLMNLMPPMTKTNYNSIVKKIHKAVKDLANTVMKNAAEELKESKMVPGNGVAFHH